MKSQEPVLELPPAAKPEEPNWQYRTQSQELESLGTSLWSWLVVVSLSVWFCFWLAEALMRAAARFPH
ncbi:MAG: hypothetical protein KGL59_13650 [Acidobacteriota bacterium]|nr:hypothetical protein [Acidobacteriota bacterium]